MGLEGLNELAQHLLLGLPSLNDRGMLACIVYSDQILNLDNAVSVAIKFAEGALNLCTSEIVHITANHPKEFIIHNDSIAVGIESAEEGANVLAAHLGLEITAGFFKLGAREAL